MNILVRTLKLFFIIFIFCLSPIAIAQQACTEIISNALESTDSACNEIGRNQTCYGHQTLNATTRSDISDFRFQEAGDIAELSAIESLQLDKLSIDEGDWGIALMKVQANLPDTLPGQNVTFLLFGDVNINDQSEQIVEVPFVASSGVNVRQRASTNSSVIASLSAGQEVVATGKLPDSSWIRVHLDNATEAWVSADFLSGDLGSLLVVEPNEAVFDTMQAFYFSTGLGESSCVEVTETGILIQTPEGAGSIELSANNVDIQLGSTIFLQAVPGDAMLVYVLEGHALLSAFSVSQFVPAGTYSVIALDDTGIASASPEYPVPYSDLDGLTALVDLLPISISIAAPLYAEEIESEIDALSNNPEIIIDGEGIGDATSNGLPPSGTWQNTAHVFENTCDPEKIPVGQVSTAYPTLTFSDDYSSMFFDFGPGYFSYTFYRASDTVYSHVNGGMVLTLTLTSPTSYFLTHRGNYGECIYYQDENGSYVGG